MVKNNQFLFFFKRFFITKISETFDFFGQKCNKKIVIFFLVLLYGITLIEKLYVSLIPNFWDIRCTPDDRPVHYSFWGVETSETFSSRRSCHTLAQSSSSHRSLSSCRRSLFSVNTIVQPQKKLLHRNCS